MVFKFHEKHIITQIIQKAKIIKYLMVSQILPVKITAIEKIIKIKSNFSFQLFKSIIIQNLEFLKKKNTWKSKIDLQRKYQKHQFLNFYKHHTFSTRHICVEENLYS